MLQRLFFATGTPRIPHLEHPREPCLLLLAGPSAPLPLLLLPLLLLALELAVLDLLVGGGGGGLGGGGVRYQLVFEGLLGYFK